MPAYLPTLTWMLAAIGGLMALGAMLGKGGGWLAPAWTRLLSGASYAFMGVSMALFVLRGLGG
ncbi:MAG: hypothetical protein KMY53_13135 [Desulfarculus sp.]|nr:hypothetical protein [Pseudomonadota bacterium]MBV1715752.1 hypothetical protein [Desulfarculus sp.]MBU4576366.1 hypothetical protein [Pseudomonadota bacterium]MBU4597289.1 hypothetical protein [Pseudomonadota bacterium]MBV1739107.1 hypothetical protein [Desulfarculus sp.]